MGVDFTSSPIEVDKRRSPNAKNIINKNGYNESRNGYKVLNTIGTKINGVWNIDYKDKELFVVHSGTMLYECSSDFKTFTNVLSGMTDNRSKGLYINGYLIIFDGTRTVVYGNFENELKAKFLDEVGYIPTTSIARDSSGGGTDYEKINLICSSRINMFLSEKDQKDFILEESNIEKIELVEVLKDSGDYEVVTNYTFNSLNSTVTFNSAPGESPVLGRDNIRIQYK